MKGDVDAEGSRSPRYQHPAGKNGGHQCYEEQDGGRNKELWKKKKQARRIIQHQRALECARHRASTTSMSSAVSFPSIERMKRNLAHRYPKHPSAIMHSFEMDYPKTILRGARRAQALERVAPCSFRTQLLDQDLEVDGGMNEDPDGGGNLDFDDANCVEIRRSIGSSPFKRNVEWMPTWSHIDDKVYRTPLDILCPDSDEDPLSAKPHSPDDSVTFVQLEEHQDTELVDVNSTESLRPQAEESRMTAMTMPFSLPVERQKKASMADSVADDVADNVIGDDMSILSEACYIPTYYPSDIMRPTRRVILKSTILSKARAARRTVRQVSRTCREAMGNAFIQPRSKVYRLTQAVRVGTSY